MTSPSKDNHASHASNDAWPSASDAVTQREDHLLAVASSVFAAKGYRQTDVQEIADRLGVGKGTVYRHFASKETLFLAAVDRSMRLLQQSVHTAAEAWQDPLDRFAAAVRGYLAFFDKHLEVVELLMQERAEFHERKKPTYFEYRDTAHADWQPLLQQLIDEQRIRPIPISRIQDVLSDTLYGVIFTNVFAGRHKSFEQQADDILDVIFHGLLTPQERARQRGDES